MFNGNPSYPLCQEGNKRFLQEEPLTLRFRSSTILLIYIKFDNDHEKIPLGHDFFLLRHCSPFASVALCHSPHGHPDHEGDEFIVRGL